MSRFDGKVAIVTGAAQGLGKKVALGFVRDGGSVVLVDLQEDRANETKAEIEASGGQAVVVAGDISKEDVQLAAVAAAKEHFGGLDAAANVAAIEPKHQPIAEVSLEDWNKVMDVNLTSTFLALKHQIPAMIERGGGSIVTISNNRGAPEIPAYIASKHAIAGLVKNVTIDYGRYGVRVNSVSPGAMNTPMLQANIAKDPNYEGWISSSIPSARVGEPAEVAEAILWLMSEQASYVYGVALSVDGGWTVK